MTSLAILTPGLGAVSTTFWAGTLLARDHGATPVGSVTQLGDWDAPFASLDELVFGAWDPYGDDAHTAATKAGVLSAEHIAAVEHELRAIRPMSAVFDQAWVRNLTDTDNVKAGATFMDLAEQLIADIESVPAERKVMVWCASTEVYRPASEVHQTIDAFERGLKESDPAIAPSQIYAYAAIQAGVPYANGAPNVAAEVPALVGLAEREAVPVCGKDFKTGQTMVKTVLGPMLKARMLGLDGWFSTNILGNRDGLVLDEPESFRSKEVSKLGVLEDILQPADHPELYGDITHQVNINYYPPRGDAKEGWDNIDLFGWLGYPMQLKVDFLCRDSILAAPIVLDLALLLDLAGRTGRGGIQEWLGFYFKSPHTNVGNTPEHDLFEQRRILDDEVAAMAEALR